MIPRILSLILCLCDWASGSKIIRSREPSANVPNSISDTGKPRTVAYYGNWDIYAPKPYFITDIPASNLTHIIYAFANVNSSTGQVYLSDTYADLEYLYPGDDPSAAGHNVYGNVKQLFLLKKKQRNLKSIISVGGGTYSSNFVPVLANDTLRQNFASSAVGIVSDLGFDGIDIDYEYVNDSIQAEQFVDLLNKTRLSLDDYATSINASNFSLSFAAPAGAQHYSVLDFSAMDKYLDFWNFMGYAYTGPWNTVSGHMANLYQSSTNALSTPVSSNTGIAYYISKGATPGKINLGCPLYGSSFNETKGPGTPFESVGTLGTYGEAGTWYYNFLPVPGFNATVTEIPEIGASFSYDPIQEYMISFDTPNIAAVKAEYVMNMGLGGSMWWEVSMDQAGNSSLIGTTVNAYGGQNALDQSLNHLDYPTSVYDNLRKGFPDSTTNSTVPTPSSSTVSWTSTVTSSLLEPSTISSCTRYHLVVSGDTCFLIEREYGLTSTQFLQWNPNVGSSCDNLWRGFYVCVGTATS